MEISTRPTLKEGTFLQNGKYKIIRFIGGGGFGCTYEAIHTVFETRVAIKEFFVKDFCNRDESSYVSVGTQSKIGLFSKLKKKFIDEAKALNNMHHEGIVHVSDLFEENGTAYYVMDYIEGQSLQEIVNKRGPLSEQEALRYILQVADALKYVHSKSRLHLDIKPGNIMVDKNGKAILIDFGASKHYDEETGENTSSLLGINTKGYAPIEQMNQSFNTFNAATDIYSLGATLYKLLTGITPPDSIAIAGGEIDTPILPDSFSENIRRAVSKAMMLKRSERPQSIADFINIINKGDLVEDHMGCSETDDEKTKYDESEEKDVIQAEKVHSNNNISDSDKKILTGKKHKSRRSVIIAASISVVCIIGLFVAIQNGIIPGIYGQKEYKPSTSSIKEAIDAHNVKDIEYYAKQGNPTAAAKLGDIYRWGLYGVTDTLSKAIYWYEKAFSLGDKESAYKLGTMYFIIQKEDSQQKAVEWLTKASESGVQKAWFYLGNALRYEEDKSESYKWIEKANQAGCLRAKNVIAEGWYDDINPQLKKNAQKELMELAKQDNPEAIGYIAGLYMNGYMGHSPRDLEGSYPWALKGYKLNDANSTFFLAWYYYDINNEEKANQYFKKAAQLGSIDALPNIDTDKPEYLKKYMELLFNGDAVLTNGYGVFKVSEYYTTNEDREKWRRRAVEYGW